MAPREENGRVRGIENVVIEEDASGPGAAIGSTEREAGTGIGSATGNAIVKGRGIVIVTENVIIVSHTHGRDHAAGSGIVNVKEIASIESEAGKKVRHVSQPGQE